MDEKRTDNPYFSEPQNPYKMTDDPGNNQRNPYAGQNEDDYVLDRNDHGDDDEGDSEGDLHLKEWMEQNNLGRYFEKFKDKGYGNLTLTEIRNHEDSAFKSILKQVGVKQASEVKFLNAKSALGMPEDTLSIWLNKLELSNLEELFIEEECSNMPFLRGLAGGERDQLIHNFKLTHEQTTKIEESLTNKKTCKKGHPLKKKGKNSDIASCEVCEGEASYFCKDCNQYFCGECTTEWVDAKSNKLRTWLQELGLENHFDLFISKENRYYHLERIKDFDRDEVDIMIKSVGCSDADGQLIITEWSKKFIEQEELKTKLKEWLKSLDLEKYYDKVVEHDYDMKRIPTLNQIALNNFINRIGFNATEARKIKETHVKTNKVKD